MFLPQCEKSLIHRNYTESYGLDFLKDSIILAAPQINQDAVRLMKELYGIDMEKKQYSKLISSIPEPDISISMGCDVGCPFIGRAFDDNWKLEDPTGKTDDDFRGGYTADQEEYSRIKEKMIAI